MQKYKITALLIIATFGLAGGCALDDDANGAAPVDIDALAITAATDIQTDHPYDNNTDQSWTITAPAWAESVSITFDRFETESYYDYLDIFDSFGNHIAHLSGNHTGETVLIEDRVVELRFHSDYSITGWGFAISSYDYVNGRPDDHRPYCSAIGSRSEGWYWGDTDELIRFERCAELDPPECGAIGSRSEGWYSNGEPSLIVWDRCHGTVRIALIGETCGPSIGYSCYGDSYCQGIPEDRIGATGTCRQMGYCETDSDCDLEENAWAHPACAGHSYCDPDTSRCAWECDPVPTGPLSWTTVLLRDVESPHPYTNNFNDTWNVEREGAEAIRVHFSRIETEEGYDRLIFTGDREEHAVMVDGRETDYWTPEFNGDTLHITLESDYSVTRWGFRADMVSFLTRLPEGMCNRDEDCEPGSACNVPRCFNPYEPCFGRCQPIATGGEGDPCDGSRPCDEGLFCKAADDDGVGQCQDELWCDDATMEADCARVIHPAVPGVWACGEEHRCSWVPTMMGGSWFDDPDMSIPDDDASGIIAELFPAGLAPCAVDVSLDLTIRHTYIGDLVVGLTDPNGQRVVVHDRDGAGADDLIVERLALAGLGDDGGNGLWTLDVSDNAGWDTGTLEHWGLHLSCR